jgi:hypothetical protein
MRYVFGEIGRWSSGRRIVLGTFLTIMVGAVVVQAADPTNDEASDSSNLLTNGRFDGPVGGGVPSPWQATMTSAEVDHAPQGTLDTVESPFESSENAIRLTKHGAASWWPQVWSPRMRLEPGPYEFTVTAAGTLPQVSLRASAYVGGQRVRLDRSLELAADPQTLTHAFVVPPGTDHVSVGISAPANIGGEVVFGRAALRALDHTPISAIAAVPPGDQPDPDPIHGLESLMERHGQKPYELFERGDQLMALRVIFHDRQFGTPVWMLDHSPTVEHGGTASVWPAWNPSGSAIYLEGTRPLDGRTHGGWFFHDNYSRLRPSQGGRPAVWAPENDEWFYGPASPSSQVLRSNWRTGQQEIIADWERLSWPNSGMRVYGLTADDRHVFVDLPNRGIFVPLERDDEHPIPVLPLYDGRPIGPGGVSIGGNHYNVIYDHPEHGDLIGLRTGMLVDRKTGETTCVAVPLCGNTNYLRAFHDGRVRYPEGQQWNDYGLPWFVDGVRLPVELSMDQLYQLWRNTPHVTHGHESTSPDWQYIAVDGGTTRIYRVSDGQARSLRLSRNGGNYHLHWRQHPRFFVGWVRGWNFGSYLRPENANIEFQIFCDTTFQPIVDTKHRFNGYYAGGDFSMLSPDATKIHYGSSMTGRFRNYIAVMAAPRPPRTLDWQPTDSAVMLQWEPSNYHHETRGYLVHRADQSGGPYRQLTAEPVDATTWRDTTIQPGKAYFYVISAVEHSGLESRYSEEAALAGIQLPDQPDTPVTVYIEPEDSIRDLPTGELPGLSMGVDRHSASDWYYLYRHPEAAEGEAHLPVTLPVTGRYQLWARVRCQGSQAARWTITAGDRTFTVGTDAAQWTWVRAEQPPLDHPTGRIELGLMTSDAFAQLDLLCLTTDTDFIPSGPRPQNTQPPPAVEGLRVDNVQPRVNQLRWQPSTSERFAHYHVYAARQPLTEPDQCWRIGSPTESELIDWGLQADTEYYYAVTVVDRQGNESPLSPLAQVKTPPREQPLALLELHFAEGQTEGSFERSTSGGTRGPAYLVPEDPDANRVSWEIEVPHDGQYSFWLRYLHRGSGNRGDEVRQSIHAAIGGRHLATLGGGQTDLHVPDHRIAEDDPLADRFWTWAWPGSVNLETVTLSAGRHTLTLSNLTPGVRYDALILTDEPAWQPPDGRLRQR